VQFRGLSCENLDHFIGVAVGHYWEGPSNRGEFGYITLAVEPAQRMSS
jgi:hypothetical protein